MRIVIRVDSSSIIGTGHLKRCLTLAKKLRQFQHTITFISRNLPGNVNHLITLNGFNLKKISFKKKDQSLNNFDSWLGSSQVQDSKDSAEILTDMKESQDLLIVDHYGLGLRWEKNIRKYFKKILVIDDLANRSHDCEILVDQNYVHNYESRYNKLVKKSCIKLLGPRYAMLGDEYISLKKKHKQDSDIRNILLYFGGADNKNYTEKALETLMPISSNLGFQISVVLNSNHKSYSKIQTLKHDNVTIFKEQSSLGELLHDCDLFIGANGATSLERLCIGIPSITINLADNQSEISQKLDSEELTILISSKISNFKKNLKETFQKVLLKKLSLALPQDMQSIVDGYGAIRIAASIDLLFKKSDQVSIVGDKNYKPVFLSESSDKEFNTFFSNKKFSVFNKYKIYYVTIRGVLCISLIIFERIDNSFIVKHKGFEELVDPYISKTFKERALIAFQKENNFTSNFQSQFSSPKIDRITICSSVDSWINEYLPRMVISTLRYSKYVTWVHRHQDIPVGTICFFLGYGNIVKKEELSRNMNNLVVHESKLPHGRGWSPMTWGVLEGKKKIYISLFEAAELVDSGKIYKQKSYYLKGTELVHQLRNKQFEYTLKICLDFLSKFPRSVNSFHEQKGKETYYPRRSSVDSMLDISKSIESQIDLLRISDYIRYPAWFYFKGNRYKIDISEYDD